MRVAFFLRDLVETPITGTRPARPKKPLVWHPRVALRCCDRMTPYGLAAT